MYTIQSTLTEDEKWYFDLHGFLVLRNVIPKDKIEAMLRVLQHWLTIDESDIPPPLHRGRQEPCQNTYKPYPIWRSSVSRPYDEPTYY